MKYFKDAYHNDNYLGDWKIFWSGAPSTVKEHNLGGNGFTMLTYVYAITPHNSDGSQSDPMLFPKVVMQVAFKAKGKHLIPVIVGLVNPRYGIDIEITD